MGEYDIVHSTLKKGICSVRLVEGDTDWESHL